MSEPQWKLIEKMPTQVVDVVWREWPDGKQESRLVSSFDETDKDYQQIMKLVEEGKLVIAPAD